MQYMVIIFQSFYTCETLSSGLSFIVMLKKDNLYVLIQHPEDERRTEGEWGCAGYTISQACPLSLWMFRPLLPPFPWATVIFSSRPLPTAGAVKFTVMLKNNNNKNKPLYVLIQHPEKWTDILLEIPGSSESSPSILPCPMSNLPRLRDGILVFWVMMSLHPYLPAAIISSDLAPDRLATRWWINASRGLPTSTGINTVWIQSDQVS